MTKLKLEEVFKMSGIPKRTFVRPMEYEKLLIALRTPGRGVVIEGPSGIGKITAVSKALRQLALDNNVLSLSARKSEDRELIASLPEFEDVGIRFLLYLTHNRNPSGYEYEYVRMR